MADAAQRERWDHTGMLWCAIAEPYRDEKKRGEPFNPAELNPFRSDNGDAEVDSFYSRFQQVKLLPEKQREGAMTALFRGLSRVHG